MSDARRQRAWLEAMDTTVEAENRAQRARQDAEAAKHDEAEKKASYFEPQGSPPESG